MELLEVIKFLRDNGYLLVSKGKYSLSKKFDKDKEIVEGLRKGKTDISDSWVSRYLQFIKDAGVPNRIETNRGEYYVGDTFTEQGMGIFKRAIESGVPYDLLIKSTKLYYHSGAKFKKKIGNYMADGDWYTDYINLNQAIITNQEERYIKTVEQDGPVDNWQY